MRIAIEEPTLQETENYVREIDRRRGEIMKRMETNAITKEIERRLVRIMEKVGLLDKICANLQGDTAPWVLYSVDNKT